MNSVPLPEVSPINRKTINSKSITANGDHDSTPKRRVAIQNFIYENGFVSKDEYDQNYKYVCNKCQKRYSSFSGYSYHIKKFDHSNPPDKYNPHETSKRGRPKGYRLANRPISLPEFSPIEKLTHVPPYQEPPQVRRGTPGRRPRGFRSRGLSSRTINSDIQTVEPSPRRRGRGGRQRTGPTRNPRRLTFEQSQKLIEVEQKGTYHIVPLDEELDIILGDESDPIPPQHQRKIDNTLVVEFKEKMEYSYEQNGIDERNNESQFYHYGNFQIMDENIIEYQMDEEDLAWLTTIKQKFPLFKNIPPESFEYIMDKLEKYSEYIVKNTDGTVPIATEEDVVCAVCLDGECSNNNAIVFCDICNIAVHQDCYGVPFVPEGPWVCRRCSHAPSKEIDCILCPLKGGVLKQTVKGSWCHIICAILMPGAFFSNSVFLDSIDISSVSHSRFNVLCQICKETKGAVIQCVYNQCVTAFHGSCAQLNGWLAVERVDTSNMDDNSTSQITHRYMPYCTRHFPADKAAARDLKMSKITNISTSKHPKSGFVPATIHVPVISDHMLNEIAANLRFSHSDRFVNFVKRYWQIKRYMRSGVPILKRRSYIPRIASYPFKISTVEHANLENRKIIIEKCKKFQDYIKIIIKILKKCCERERLKANINSLKTEVIRKLTDYDLFSKEIALEINSFYKNTNEFIQINSSNLIEIYENEIGNLSFLSTEDFYNSITLLIEEYIKKFSPSKKVNSYISTFKKSIKNIFKIKPNAQTLKTPPKVSLNGNIKENNSIRSSEKVKNSFNSKKTTPVKELNFIPSSEEAKAYAKSLTEGLKPTHSTSQEATYMKKLSRGFLVWARFRRCKNFPAKVLKVNPISNKEQSESKKDIMVDLEIFDPQKTHVSLPLNDLEPLGLSAAFDLKIIEEVLNSKSFGREQKRVVFESYAKAISHIDGDSSFSKVKTKN